jgi:hypothetical protein
MKHPPKPRVYKKKPGGMTRAQSGRLGAKRSPWRSAPACCTGKAAEWFRQIQAADALLTDPQ